MCGRFTLTKSGEEVAEAFGLDEVPELQPRYNIAPSQPVAVVRRLGPEGARSLAFLRWGLVSKSDAGSRPLINARAETAASRPAFREALAHRRCLIPADGFFEWEGPSGGRGRQPYYLQVGGGVLFGLGPIFSVSEWGNDAGRLEAGRVRAGRHLLMSNTGVLALLDVQSERSVSLELGSARVEIETPEPADPVVYLLPEEARSNPAAHYWAHDFFAKREGGRLVFAPLAAGRYALFVEGRDTAIPLDLAEGQELVIPRAQWLTSQSQR